MKKFVALFLCLISVVFCFSSCFKSEEVKAVEEKIETIGNINLAKLTRIEEAEAAFELLSAEDKDSVKNYDKLTQAREEYDKLALYKEKADALSDLYERVFTEYGISYEMIADGNKYLTDTIETVSDSVKNEYEKILYDIQDKHDYYSDTASQSLEAIQAYLSGFFTMKNTTDIKIVKLGCIAQMDDGKMYYLFALTYDDGTGAEKNVYAQTRFADVPAVETMTTFADSFYASAPVSEETDALKYGNIYIRLSENAEE